MEATEGGASAGGAEPKELRTLNVNVGILGHIDSGKTSLAKGLSTMSSTAAFDKSPQSKDRGITLDLGFSAFTTPMPSHLADLPYDQLQYTLVDCPGHASLIRTIIGGAQIIDMMMLVIDVTKGIQTQTAEGLVVGEITTDKLLVVLNKTDLLPEAERETHIKKMKERISKVLQRTRFAGADMVAVAAAPSAKTEEASARDLSVLIAKLQEITPHPQRKSSGPFVFSVDHCFPIRGQGTVMTGTVLSGQVQLNDVVEIAALKVQKKVKSMQMFKRPVTSAKQGDRVGICVTQFDAKLLERGLVASPGHLLTVSAAVVSAVKIKYYRAPVQQNTKFHVTVGHSTVMATAFFFGIEASATPSTSSTEASSSSSASFDPSGEYLHQAELFPVDKDHPPNTQFAFLRFEKPVICPPSSLVIASRLDTDIHANTCRLAFHGRMLTLVEDLHSLNIYKYKQREGTVDRLVDDHTIIGKGFFKKQTDIQPFLGLKVERSPGGDIGILESPFGKTGKFKIHFPEGGQKEPKGKLLLRYKTYPHRKSAPSTQHHRSIVQ